MRIQIFSDVHADVFTPKKITVAPDVDAVVVAGDISEGAEHSFYWLRNVVPMHIPIVMVMGNHEFYRHCLPEELTAARVISPFQGVHLLENDTVTVDGTRFVGCTLWTDYLLFGPERQMPAMHYAAMGLNDHRRIAWSKQPWKRFRPQEALNLHIRSRAFLERTLATPFDGPTVVVTHHAPHRGSLAPIYERDLMSAAFVSDLSSVVEAGQPDIWTHGHVHSSFDYRVGKTRVVCNPHGYAGENPAFDPALIVTVGEG